MTIEKLSPDIAAWCAGVMSMMGTFSAPSIYKPQVRSQGYRYELKSSKHPEAVQRFAHYLGLPVRRRARGDQTAEAITISSDDLSQLMRQVWPYLTKARRLEYSAVKRTSDSSILF